MPGLNRRGPQGQGAMSGRAMGICTNFGADKRNRKSDDAGENQQQSDIQNQANQNNTEFTGYGFGNNRGGGNFGGFGKGGRGQGGQGLGRQHRNRMNGQ